MKLLRWAAFLLGLCAIIALMFSHGLARLGSVLERGGVKLLIVPAVMFIPLMLDAKGWQVLVKSPASLHRFLYARWIGESVNTLLPMAHVGGLVIKSYLLGKGKIARSLAIASAVVADTVSAVTLLFFIAFSLIAATVSGLDTRILILLGCGALLFCIPVYIFFRLQIGGPIRLHPRLKKWSYTLTSIVGVSSDIDDIKKHLKIIYSDKNRLIQSFLYQFLGWIFGTCEIWLITYLLGRTISVTDAFILEGLGQTVRNVAFFIPGALGVQEGAYMLVGPMLGLTPVLSLSISLVKRFRELVQGIPGLAIWQASEGWTAIRRLRRLYYAENNGSEQP